MTEANRKAATRSASKLAVAAILCMGIGVYVGKTLSEEAPRPPRTAGTAEPLPVRAEAGYLPSQLVNQAKNVEPLPATF